MQNVRERMWPPLFRRSLFGDDMDKQIRCMGTGCPHHCCGDFNGISTDLLPLGDVPFQDIILLPEEVVDLKKAGLEEFVTEADYKIPRLKVGEGGTCSALVDGKCSIYNHRPAICKAYPLYIDMFVGMCAHTLCPSFDLSVPIDEYKDAVNSLLKIYQYWIDYYSKLIK